MKAKLKIFILITLVICIAMAACDSASKRTEQAQELYQEGVQLREQQRGGGMLPEGVGTAG